MRSYLYDKSESTLAVVRAGERAGEGDCEAVEGQRAKETRPGVEEACEIYSSTWACFTNGTMAFQDPLSLYQEQLERNHEKDLRQLEEKLFSQCGRIGQGHIDAQSINEVRSLLLCASLSLVV